MRKFWINLAISLAIGALFVWLAARDVKWTEVKQVFSEVNIWMVISYFLILLAIHFVRIIRWGILLKPLGRISFGRLFSVGSVGIMALMLLPLRLGEFARPLLIAERGKIRPSAALATVVVERVVDSLAMAALLVTLLFFLEDRVIVPLEIRSWAILILGLFVVLLLLLILAYRHQDRAMKLFGVLLKPLPERIAKRLLSTLKSFISGLRILPNVRLLAAFLFITVIYWGMAGLGLWYVFGAFPGLSKLGAVEAFAVLSVLCVGLMIPAGPGMIGNFHYFVKLGLSLFVAETIVGSSGVAYAILVHALQLGQQVLLGLPFLFTSHISFSRILSAPSRLESSLEQDT